MDEFHVWPSFVRVKERWPDPDIRDLFSAIFSDKRAVCCISESAVEYGDVLAVPANPHIRLRSSDVTDVVQEII